MTTTAHEDQFTVGTQTIEPVRELLSKEAILRRNIADVEKEMQRQAERAEHYSEVLRSLASYVGAGGYNADAVDAGVFEEKIRWGIGEIMARMEKAEAELKGLAQQKPVAWMHDKDGRVDTCHDSVKELWIKVGQKQNTQFMREIVPCRVEHYNIPLYAAPVPAPAVPDEWREVMSKLVGIVESSTKFHGCDDVTKQARALLQSADRLLEGGE